MSAMATRTVEVSSNQLDTAVEVLSTAGQALQLTRFERIAYRSLMVSADVAMASFLLCLPIQWLLGGFSEYGLGDPLGAQGLKVPFEQLSPSATFAALIFAGLALVFVAAILVGIILLVISIPLLLKTFRESARLKQLGLTPLSRSLLKESQRGSWKSWVRRFLFFGALFYFSLDVFGFFTGHLGNLPIIAWGLYFAVVPGLIIAARYLRNQRERMELTASAEDLKKALQSLQQRRGAEVISVPAELLEKTAKIESAQIANERKDAVLQSVTSRPTGYAIGFDRIAAEQRATLDVADRVELEDLVEKLSTDGTQVKPQVGTGQGRTKSNRVEIDYVIDNASHAIRVIAVRHVGEVSHASANGAGHA
jgi:hypothetical protein